MPYLLLLLAVLTGAILPMQVGMNATLRQTLGHPILASLTSFSIGTLCLVMYALINRLALPSLSALSENPWWAWLGGAVGAIYVSMAVILGPKLGAATLISATIAGQMCCAMALDHFGVMGFAVKELNFYKVLGAAFLVIGVVLIQRN